MGNRRFEISDVLGDSWTIFKENMGTLIVGWVIATAAMTVLSLFALPFDIMATLISANEKQKAGGGNSGMIALSMVLMLCAGVLKLVNTFISMWMTGGMMYFFTRAAKRQEILFRSLFVFDIRIVYLFITMILMGLGIILGLILLIVPGIILMLMWSQAIYLVMDRNMGPIEALGKSRQLMKGNKLRLLVLYALVTLIVIFGVIFTCGIGIFFVSPWSTLVFARVYAILSEEPAPPLIDTQAVPLQEIPPTASPA